MRDFDRFSARKPCNILFFILDGVRYDTLGYSGRDPTPTPALDSFFREGRVFSQAYSPGCPTQFAFPPIFTSTLPLDQGGYEYGIRCRSAGFVELLREHGYRTGAFVSGGWANRFHGYDRGIDSFHHLFDISLFLRNYCKFDLDYATALYEAGTLRPSDCVDRLGPSLAKVFPFLGEFCREKIQELKSGSVSPSPEVHGWNFTELEKKIEVEERAFRENPRGYVMMLMTARQSSFLFGAMPTMKKSRLKSTSAYVLESMCRWVAKGGVEPFFAWAHLMDVHDVNFVTHDIMQSQAALRRELLRILRMHTLILKGGSEYSSDPEYDFALTYMDEHIGRLRTFLENKKLLDDTLIVMISDHGSRRGKLPPRESVDIISFYDELLHVPMAFVHPDIRPGTDDRLVSTMDVGPTILRFLGLPVPDEFRGRPLFEPGVAERDHLIMENLGRGPCDFAQKPVRIGVRTRTEKIVFESPPENSDGSGSLTEAYDLVGDPGESRNIVGEENQGKSLSRLERIARERCREIRRVESARTGDSPAEHTCGNP